MKRRDPMSMPTRRRVPGAGRLPLAAALLAAGSIALAQAGLAPPEPPSGRMAASQPGVLPGVLTFEQALELAWQFNPRLRGLDERRLELRARRVELRAEALPQLGLDGALNARDSGLIEAFGPGASPRTESWRMGLGLEQPIYRGGLARAMVSAQDHRIAASDQTRLAARQDVMFETARAFCAALLARESIEARIAAIGVYERLRDDARRRVDVGVGSGYDALQAEVALSNAQPPLLRARLQYRLAVEELRLAIGLPFPAGLDPDEVVVEGDWPFPALTAAPEEALGTALRNRPELAALSRELAAAEADARAVRATRLPHIAATAGYGWNSRQFGDTWRDSLSGWQVGVRASMPLWTSGLADSRAAQARSRVRQLLWREAELRSLVEVDVARALAEWRVAAELHATSADRIRQAAEAQRQARSRFDAGTLPQVEVLLATLDLTQARLDRSQAAHDVSLAVAALSRAMGVLSVVPGEPAR